MLKIEKIKKELQSVSTWAGGTTTQLAIYPKDASYADRSFLWRLSTAVVELEESSFTKLPGFDRYLMLLEGELKVVHREQHTAVLQQYGQDRFKGGWDTTSYGKARDFNLMVKDGCQGSIDHWLIEAEMQVEKDLIQEQGRNCFFACYCFKGGVSVEVKDQKEALEQGDLLLVEFDGNQKLTLKNAGGHECHVIIANIGI